MEQKENDMLLNVMQNPSFSIQDFQDIGIDASNTSLQSRDIYQNSQTVQQSPVFKDSTGDFDQSVFNKVYNTAAGVYNAIAQNPQAPQNDFHFQLSKYDIDAPENLINPSSTFSIDTHSFNPDLRTYSTVRVGMEGPRTQTAAEIAQSKPVWNEKTQSYEDSPESSFLGNVGKIRALAQYTADEDINGKKDGEPGFDKNNIAHHEGELKINPDTGTYYYEDISGQNIHNRQLLHLSDVITNESSPLNAIDFMDSDDIHKSAFGSIMKNATLVGAMFAPVVGPYITGLTIAQQAASFGATLGKMAVGSDNALCNYIQGLSEQTNFSRTRSEYSQQSMWTFENLFGMIGDTVAQLKQQRMLFELLPRLVGYDGRVLTKEGQEAWKLDRAKQLATGNEAAIQEKFKMPMQQLALTNGAEYYNALSQLSLNNKLKAARDLDTYMDQYWKNGGVLSKAYMTLLTVNDTYDNAKKAGASDELAGLTTIGYAAMEYGLLSTGLGEWVLPELRAGRMRNKAILNALTKDTREMYESALQKASTPEAKHKIYAKIMNFGKRLFTADYNVGRQGTLGKTILSTGAAALGEGTEEVSEDVLQDFVNTCYNLYNESVGSTSRMHNENWKDQYLMDFLGGFIGGGIGNAAISFHTAKETLNMTPAQAMQQLVYMSRNQKDIDGFYKFLDKSDVGNKYLSATKVVQDENGNVIGWEQGTKDDNQNDAIKNLVRKNIGLVQDVLKVDGADIDDNSLFTAQTLHDLRWQYLYNSTTTARLIENFNDLATRALKLHSDIAQERAKLPDQKSKLGSPEYADTEKIIADKEAELSDLQQQIHDIRNGKKATRFMAPALLETSPYILDGFLKSATFEGFASVKEGKEFSKISEERKTQLKEDYDNYVNFAKKQDVDVATQQYLNASRRFAQNFDKLLQAYQDIDNNPAIKQQFQQINDILHGIETTSSDEDLYVENVQGAADKMRSYEINEENALYKNMQQARDDGMTEILDSNTISEAGYKNIFDSTNAWVNGAIGVYSNVVDNLEDTGYITPQLKSDLLKKLDGMHAALVPVIERLGDIESEETYSDRVEDLENYIEDTEENTKDKIKNLKDRINALGYTPMTLMASDYVHSVYGGDFNITELMQNLQQSFDDSAKDVGSFILDEDTLSNIDRAINILSQIQSVTEGARSDKATLQPLSSLGKPIDNIWGINKTLNDIAKKSGDLEWKDLPTIESPVADAIYVDIETLKNKLSFYKKLVEINKGAKLGVQVRVSANYAYLEYRKLQDLCKLCDVAAPDWDKTALETALASCTFLHDNVDDKRLQLSNDELATMRKEQLTMEDAIYDFFQANSGKNFKDILKGFDIINAKPTLLTESSTDIDDRSFIGILAAKASIKSSTLYKWIAENTDPKKFVPLDTQILGVQLGIANAINGDFVTRFQKSAREAALDKFYNASTFEERFNWLTADPTGLKLSREQAILLSSEHAKVLIESAEMFPKYQNITFTEGVPGAGKTSAVDGTITEFLRANYPDVLKGAWCINTNTETASALQSSLGLTDGKAFDKVDLLKTISEWEEPTVNPDGTLEASAGSELRFESSSEGFGIVSKYALKDVSELPKVIFLDEVSRFTQEDLDILDKFARTHGISVIASGDYDQSTTKFYLQVKQLLTTDQINNIYTDIINNAASLGITKTFSVDDVSNLTFTLGSTRKTMLSVPKIGTSMRSLNTQQDINQSKMLARMAQQNETKSFTDSIELHYWESANELHGTKVVLQKDVDEVTKFLDKIIPTLADGEKVCYIYTDTKSVIYQKLVNTPKYKDKLELYPGTSALGLEGKYWILEPNYNQDTKDFLQDLYTGISRASKGSILVRSNDYVHTAVAKQIPKLESIQDVSTTELRFQDKDKERYSKKMLDSINNALAGMTVDGMPAYAERTDVTVPPGLSGPKPKPKEKPKPSKGASVFAGWWAASRDPMTLITQYLADSDQTTRMAELDDMIKNETDPSVKTALENLKMDIEDAEDQVAYNNIINNTLLPPLFTDDREIDQSTTSTGNDLFTFRRLQFNFTGLQVAAMIGNYDRAHQPLPQTFKTFEYDRTTKRVIFHGSLFDEEADLVDIYPPLRNYINGKIAAPELSGLRSGIDNEFEDDSVQQIETEIDTAAFEKYDTFRLDSTFSFETGWLKDPSNPDMYMPTSFANARIDGFNGFFTQDASGNMVPLEWCKSLFSSGVDFKRAISIMAGMRQMMLNKESKGEIETYVQRLLKLPSAHVVFALKSGERHDSSSAGARGSGKWGRFDKDSNESIIGVDSTDNRDKLVNNRKIVAIIQADVSIGAGGHKKSDVLEIPLMDLNSPLSKIEELILKERTTVASGTKGDLETLWHAICRQHRPNGVDGQHIRERLNDFYQIIGYKSFPKDFTGAPVIYDEFKDSAGNFDPTKVSTNPKFFSMHRALAALCHLYTTDNRMLFTVNNDSWTPSNAFKNLGVQHNSFRGDDMNTPWAVSYYNEQLVQNTERIALEECMRPDLNFSKVYNYKGSDTSIVSNPGHSFVLYTSNPDMTDNEMIDLYIRQKEALLKHDTSVPQIVRLKYLDPPKITATQFVNSIMNFWSTGGSNKPLGNNFTGFKLLRGIMLDPKTGDPVNETQFKKLLTDAGYATMVNDMYNILLTKVKEFNAADSVQQANMLSATGDWTKAVFDKDDTVKKNKENALNYMLGSTSGKSLKQQLDTIILRMVAPKVSLPIHSRIQDSLMKELQALADKSNEVLYLQPKLQPTTVSTAYKSFVQVQQDKDNFRMPSDPSLPADFDYRFTIIGRLGTNQYKTTEGFANWLEDIVFGSTRTYKLLPLMKEKVLSRVIYFSSDQNKSYVDGAVNTKSSKKAGFSPSTKALFKELGKFLPKTEIPDTCNTMSGLLDDTQLHNLRQTCYQYGRVLFYTDKGIWKLQIDDDLKKYPARLLAENISIDADSYGKMSCQVLIDGNIRTYEFDPAAGTTRVTNLDVRSASIHNIVQAMPVSSVVKAMNGMAQVNAVMNYINSLPTSDEQTRVRNQFQSIYDECTNGTMAQYLSTEPVADDTDISKVKGILGISDDSSFTDLYHVTFSDDTIKHLNDLYSTDPSKYEWVHDIMRVIASESPSASTGATEAELDSIINTITGGGKVTTWDFEGLKKELSNMIKNTPFTSDFGKLRNDLYTLFKLIADDGMCDIDYDSINSATDTDDLKEKLNKILLDSEFEDGYSMLDEALKVLVDTDEAKVIQNKLNEYINHKNAPSCAI